MISHSHGGLRVAIQAVLVGVGWRRGYAHLRRSVPRVLPRTHEQLAVAAFRTAFMQPNLESAKERFGRAIAALEKRFPEGARGARDAEDEVLCYMSFPAAHWRQIPSTSPLERLNREIRHCTDVVGIFSNDAARLRLVSMLLVEPHDGPKAGESPSAARDRTAVRRRPPLQPGVGGGARAPLDGTLLPHRPYHGA